MNYKKDFDKWNIQKKEIDQKENFKPPFFKEGEVWWIRVGENIGNEISGKSEIFTRPVVVYKKLSSKMFLAIPLTTKDKEGSWFVKFKFNAKNQIAVLSQIRVVSYRRMTDKIGQIDKEDYKKIKQGFEDLFY